MQALNDTMQCALQQEAFQKKEILIRDSKSVIQDRQAKVDKAVLEIT